MSSLLDDDDLWDDMPVVHASDNKKLDLDDEDQKKFHYRAPAAKLDAEQGDDAASSSDPKQTSGSGAKSGKKGKGKDKGAMEYTRLELDDDVEGDSVHMRTDFLFDDTQEMTPLSQMKATKDLLNEGQRIAYVGLCKLITREMVQSYRLGRTKELEAAAESAQHWANKIMGRLYVHMEVSQSEQRMFDQLAEHGVLAMDLVPSLVTTHDIPNPDFNPDAASEPDDSAARSTADSETEEEDDVDNPFAAPRLSLPKNMPSFQSHFQPDAEGDLGWSAHAAPTTTTTTSAEAHQPQASTSKLESDDTNATDPLPNTLPGVSTELTANDATITLDIRWTVLCDLFLALIADSVYDSRSRVLLANLAKALGLDWPDVLRFERRLTEALQLQEGVDEEEQDEVMDARAKKGRNRRYAMMAAAGLGGGLVIGLSAGLLAPVIGAGIGATLGMVGVTGTSTFLAGTGGAAIITTGGVLTGSSIASRGMGRRTASIKTFEFLPLHNNKRVSCLITVPGFLKGRLDDARLPFSTLDPIIGDVFSVLWEPDTILQTGNALKILTSEVLSSAGQQILGATIMTGLMAGIAIPVWLSKLSYLIDNPWSNALDRAWSAGAVLADVLMKRHLGVRPVSLVGFSLGARSIFYCLLELAKHKAFGIVQDVYLLGATLTASSKQWREVRGVVSGRLVNAYSGNDWILGYLYRASTGGLSTVAGLSPVEDIPDVENIDITSILDGHMSYRSKMPLILQHLGFKITADHFDEPDDEDLTRPDREVLTKEEEERRAAEREKKRQKPDRWKWIRRKKTTSEGQSEEMAGSSSPGGGALERSRPSYDSLEKSTAAAAEGAGSGTSTPATEADVNPARRDSGVFDTERLQREIHNIQEQDPSAMKTTVEVHHNTAPQATATLSGDGEDKAQRWASPPQSQARGDRGAPDYSGTPAPTPAAQHMQDIRPSWTTAPSIQLPGTPAAGPPSSSSALPSWDDGPGRRLSSRAGEELEMDNPFSSSSLVFAGSDGVPIADASSSAPGLPRHRGNSQDNNPWL